MYIRKTEINDLSVIMKIYEHARRFMAEHGNPDQWGPRSWPPEYLIRNDISEGCSYVCVDDGGIIRGTFYYKAGYEAEPLYRTITGGAWVGPETYGVVHRIASDGKAMGTGTFCLGWALEQCGHLRIDTHSDNTVMQNLLDKLGFTRCGTVYVTEDDSPRTAYEKMVPGYSRTIIYHSGFSEIKDPDIRYGRKNADFGQGFYLTPDRPFAEKWFRERIGKKTILNTYEFDTEGLMVKRFERDQEWFGYINSNRHSSDDYLDEYDVITGPVANDIIYDVLGIITSGVLSKEQSLELLLLGPEFTQTVLKTDKARNNLKFIRSETIPAEIIWKNMESHKREEAAYQNAFAAMLNRMN